MNKIAKMAVPFYCGRCNTFMTHSHCAIVMTSVRMIIERVGKDPEQNQLGCFAEFKINSGILHCFKRKI